ncbi:2-octaprenyl-6-methoxyphenyl hydroxylase [Ferrimonas marina]|uniref:2-octaprenyl-6-methoxyphenol hydroxylase n=1 Tax=Ferrimonas marina TaxID=299255 RepID=A0A1M5ZF52_9GAMM|nr:2-octaprenyl-6-methoxyphenyl hydroxylase [Ferrimonas marina]SHI22866.1 2-octaprenyl-6-methoxyphenol hydroxylase [Ferrimonas marina]
MKQHYDIAIVGGAMAGATLALALSARGDREGRPWRIAVIEAHTPESQRHPGYDTRAIALAEGSVRRLKTLGCWPAIQAHAAPIERIEVSDQGHFGGLAMASQEYGVEALGQVVELERVGPALWQQLAKSGVDCFSPDQLAELTQQNDQVALTLTSGQQLTARLVVGADGTHSKVREKLGLGLRRTPYPQTALIANLSARDHGATAYERFTAEGPLALLPMCDDRYSLVWVQSPEQAQRRLQLSEAQFLAELQQAFGYRLGRFTQVGQRASYPLALCKAERVIHHRCVLVGNAAQTVHPIAGQGFNLGLRDVEVLAHLLSQADDPGAFSLLAQYEQQRRNDRGRTTGWTDLLVRLFSNSSRVMALGRNSGLLAMSLLPGLKRQLAGQAMGWRGGAPRHPQQK